MYVQRCVNSARKYEAATRRMRENARQRAAVHRARAQGGGSVERSGGGIMALPKTEPLLADAFETDV